MSNKQLKYPATYTIKSISGEFHCCKNHAAIFLCIGYNFRFRPLAVVVDEKLNKECPYCPISEKQIWRLKQLL